MECLHDDRKVAGADLLAKSLLHLISQCHLNTKWPYEICVYFHLFANVIIIGRSSFRTSHFHCSTNSRCREITTNRSCYCSKIIYCKIGDCGILLWPVDHTPNHGGHCSTSLCHYFVRREFLRNTLKYAFFFIRHYTPQQRLLPRADAHQCEAKWQKSIR